MVEGAAPLAAPAHLTQGTVLAGCGLVNERVHQAV